MNEVLTNIKVLDEQNNQFVSYLNTLHNYNAMNSNAFTENNISNDFYKQISVHNPISNQIYEVLKNDKPHIIILTGHAGDGKTGIMAQVLALVLKHPIEKLEICKVYDLCNGNKCAFIKDFSEYTAKERLELMTRFFCNRSPDTFVFMVANTGPLINTFRELFHDKDKESASSELIDAINSAEFEKVNIKNFAIRVINLSNVDNSQFAEDLIHKIAKNETWSTCGVCKKKECCHIYNNIRIIQNNISSVANYLKYHYFYLAQYGHRQTVRNISEQVAFMITGARSCCNIGITDKTIFYKFLFCNLFWGIFGLQDIPYEHVPSIVKTRKYPHYKKKLSVDEILFISKDYSSVFEPDVIEVIGMAEKKIRKYDAGSKRLRDNCWVYMLRRIYMFLAKNPNYNQIFSPLFIPYYEATHDAISLDRKSENWKRLFRDLICIALSMIFTGNTKLYSDTKKIFITQNRSIGLVPTVSLVIGSISTEKFNIELKRSHNYVNSKQHKLVLKLENIIMSDNLTLPLLDYFNDVKSGIISTNIDPQLTHELENIKTVLQNYALESDLDSEAINFAEYNGKFNISISYQDLDLKDAYYKSDSLSFEQLQKKICTKSDSITESETIAGNQLGFSVFQREIPPRNLDPLLFKLLDFDDLNSFNSAQMPKIIVCDSKYFQIHGCSELFIGIIQYLYSCDSTKFKELNIRSIKLAKSSKMDELRIPMTVASDIVVETNYEPHEIMIRINNLCKELKFDKTKFKVYCV